jgi:hypothetical protein
MTKRICKNLVWLALPLGLAMGCASHESSTTTAAVYGPTPVLTPTSGEPEQRIYSTDPNAATTSVNAAPPGANQQDWNVAEAIRARLTADPTLAPAGSSLISEVGNGGVVTLKGSVQSENEKDRVKATISNIQGVSSVNDDQLKIGQDYHGAGKLDTMSE